MTAVEEFAFWTGLGELRLQVMPSPTVLLPKEKELAKQVGFIVRVGLEWREPRTVQLAQELMLARFQRPVPFAEEGFLRDEERSLEDVGATLAQDLLEGRIRVRLAPVDPLRELEQGPPSKLDPLPPPKPDDTTTFFELRLVDEIGKAISGVSVEFTIDGELRDVTTNAAGVALLENVTSMSAAALAPDADELEKVLEPRWITARTGRPPREGNVTEHLFVGEPVGPVDVKPAVPNTMVIEPPLGRLFVELFDKTGRVLHAKREYTIDGPVPLSGTTDDAGRLVHDDVFPGDYKLTLTVDFFDGKAEQSDTYESPLVVLAPGETKPTVRRLGVLPFSVLARLHFFFNTNKAFLLPTALSGIRALQKLYFENNPSKLLVVGHADTTGDPALNDKLSLDRARATVAFLKDDVDAWLEFYGSGMPPKQRWGAAEDRMMLCALPDFALKPKGEDAVTWFQETRGLTVDGKAGPQTRRQLVTEYMGLDGTSLGAPGLGIDATAHGCGENFPLDESGEIDAAPADGQPDPNDRRVELFFFDPEFGIVPPPPGNNSGKGSSEYPLWRASVIETHDIEPDEFEGPQVTFIELLDAHFRSNSSVVLPQGESPTVDRGRVNTVGLPGVFATALRFNADHAEKRVFIAGHTDTTATIEFNQKLSEERARCALALLVGGSAQREAFTTICNGRHTVADTKEILAWVAQNFGDLGFNCAPSAIDENRATAVPAVKKFQSSYNANIATFRRSNPESEELMVNGDVGPETWGAFFDCYELALQRELGVDAPGLQALRSKLVFVDDERRALGFSEYFPIEELGVDKFKSQANRRVEILFFDRGEEPDLVAAQDDPETAELYLPGNYERVPLGVLVSAKPWRATWDASTVSMGQTRTMRLEAPGLPAGTPLTWTLLTGTGEELTSLSSASGAEGATLDVNDWVFPEAFADGVVLDAGDEFDPCEFLFNVSGADRIETSEAPLTYADSLRTRIAVSPSFDENVAPLGLPYVVHTLAGSRRGITQSIGGEDGWVVEDGLPPGGATLIVEDVEAVVIRS